MSDAEVEEHLKKKPVWPYLLTLALLLSAGAGAGVYFATRPDPKLVLVAVDIDGYWWEGSEASAIVTDQFAARLEELGFTPVKSGDPEVTALLEGANSPEAAQRELGAGFLVSGRLAPEYVEHPIEGGYTEARTRGDVSIRYLDEERIEAGTVDGWSGAKEKQRANQLLGQAVADRVFDRAIAAMMEHPVLQEILAGPDAIERGKLQRAKAYVELRKQRLAEAKSAYARLLKARKQGEKGGHDIRYHGSFDSDDSLCGVSASGFLSKRSKIRPFFSPRNNELAYYRELDHLVWVGFDQREQDVVRGYNLYSYPAASPDGSTVVYIEDIFGWAKTITVVQRSAAPKRVRVDHKHRFQAPRVAPNGKHVAVFDKPCRKCPSNLLVADLSAGKTRYLLEASQGEVSGFDWLSADQLLVAFQPFAPPPAEQNDHAELGISTLTPTQAPPGGLFRVDLSRREPQLEPVYEAQEGERFHWVRSSRDGKFVVLPREAPDGAGLARFDTSSNELRTYPVARPYMPEVNHDGSAAVFEQDGEIMLFRMDEGDRKQLTNNSARDRYPVFSVDAKRVYYESLGDDPNFSRTRNVSIVASVAVP